MKKNLIKFTTLFVLILSWFITTSLVNPVDNEESKIIGTWISENDIEWKLIFTGDKKCTQFYSNQLIESDNYLISNTSPQCGIEVTIDSLTSYLSIENSITLEKSCYEIYGISDSIRSISPIGVGGVIIFNRQ